MTTTQLLEARMCYAVKQSCSEFLMALLQLIQAMKTPTTSMVNIHAKAHALMQHTGYLKVHGEAF